MDADGRRLKRRRENNREGATKREEGAKNYISIVFFASFFALLCAFAVVPEFSYASICG
jgi:hypothetical protein